MKTTKQQNSISKNKYNENKNKNKNNEKIVTANSSAGTLSTSKTAAS